MVCGPSQRNFIFSNSSSVIWSAILTKKALNSAVFRVGSEIFSDRVDCAISDRQTQQHGEGDYRHAERPGKLTPGYICQQTRLHIYGEPFVSKVLIVNSKTQSLVLKYQSLVIKLNR